MYFENFIYAVGNKLQAIVNLLIKSNHLNLLTFYIILPMYF